MIKVGIIGSGFGLNGLLPAFYITKGCKVISICGRETDKMVSYCRNLGLNKIYLNWQEMLDKEKLDALAIAVTPIAQYQIAKVAINKGLHIFAEKPLAATLIQAQELLKLAEKNKIKHTVDFIFPEIEEWNKVKQMLDKKSFGKLKHVYLNWDFFSYHIKNGIKSWKTDVSVGGGALSLYFCHSLYYLEYLAGKIINIKSRLSYSSKYLDGSERKIDMLLTFSKGVSGYAHLSCDTPGLNRHQLILICEKATIVLENEGESWVNFAVKIYSEDGEKRLSRKRGEINRRNEDDRVRVVKKITSKFIDSIIQDKKVVPSFVQGVRVQELIEKIRENKY